MERIARRTTFDGIVVELWADGSVTDPMRVLVVPARGDATEAIRAALLAFEDVEMYDHADVARLVRVAKAARRQTREGLHGYIRRVMAGEPYRPTRPAPPPPAS
jgi:hypothetical protein